jgi:hypothetical protein
MRTVLRGFASALVLLIVAGCEKPPSALNERPAEAPVGQLLPAQAMNQATLPTRIDLATSDADYLAERFGNSYQLSAFDDLVVRVRFGGEPPIGKTVALEIYAPGAGLLSVYRREVDARDNQIIVPVSGTEITKRQLTGQYALIVTVEGVDQPVASTTLELRAPGGAP